MTATTSDDRPLIARARQGQSGAFNELYARHVRPVYWQAYAVVGNAQDAEETTQDVFITAWKKLSSIEIAGESLLPWLLVTARYTALNRRRKSWRHSNVVPLDASVPDVAPTAEEQHESALILERVTECVADLNEVDQELYDLCINGDQTYAAAAERLGVTHGVVRNRVSRIRQRLRSDLASVKETP
ncbi:MAG: polymerase subunit sigma-24 [Nocardioidaceae bacterium]|nr:polymerase subunit sigma-24 [Nocardioidaceae bacterium]